MKLAVNRKTSTYLKYLISYVLIFTVLMLCFFFLLRSQLQENYGARQRERVTTQTEAAAEHLASEINFLYQTDDMITRNSDIKLATYRAERKYLRITQLELQQYAKSSSLIDSIVYHSRYSGHVFYTGNLTTLADGVYTFTDTAMNKTVFDPTPYLDCAAGQLIRLGEEKTEYLLWFPSNRSGARYLFYYILDTKVIQSQLNTLLSNEVLAVALLDGEGRCVTGSGFGPYETAFSQAARTQGIHTLEDGGFLCVSQPLQDGFVLVAAVSGAVLQEQVSGAFVRSYLSLLVLSLVGLVLVYVSMHLTYRPLHRLVKSLGHEAGRNQNYLELISQKHSELTLQKDRLEQTLAEYRETVASMASRAEEPEYPHEALGTLTVCLRERRFADARALTETLLTPADGTPVYFAGCIALDCLTVIANSMNRSHIPFEHYSEAYTQAVRQCRSIRQPESFGSIREQLLALMDFYAREISAKALQTAPLKQFVEGRFRDPDFSIGEMAESFHLSIPRMSSLFKEEMGIGFLDYVWQLRLETGQRLLRETELSVDEIAQSVGYLASTSFSRKFKQETGMTPSQYREASRKQNP